MQGLCFFDAIVKFILVLYRFLQFLKRIIFTPMRFVLLGFFFISFLPSLGQGLKVPLPTVETYEYDTSYIESFNSKFALRFVIPRRIENFSIKDTRSNKKYNYSSNEHYGVGIGFTYRWLAVDMTINPDFTQRDVTRYGNTKEFNLKGSAYLKRNLLDVYLRSYKGYYISNPSDIFFFFFSEQPYPQRQNIRTLGWGINYTIPFNWKKYSPKVTFVLDGKLKKSAGSFMAISSAYFYHLRADSSITDNLFAPEGQIHAANMALLSGLFGYAYTFVYKDFYATLSAFPGLTLPIGTVYSTAGSEHPRFTANFKLMLRGGIGYNSDRWYTGIYVIFDVNQVQLPDNILLGNGIGEIRFFIAYRLKPPKVVDKVMDKL